VAEMLIAERTVIENGAITPQCAYFWSLVACLAHLWAQMMKS